jgi:iron complex outermembrane receptor protein
MWIEPLARRLGPLALCLCASVAQAQAAADGPAAAPLRAASSPARAGSAPAATEPTAQRLEIVGGRESDADQRRKSTAAKIIIGREEIDKFGDATVGEVLRRLPGVTTPGPPGRGGPPRMRGLGSGYTQLLIDGQRIPPGFSLESLTPEQIERIEILRAPSAETGSQAIAGTINIITREGYKRRLTDLRAGLGYENGKVSPGLNWTHNDSAGDLTYNLSGSLFMPRRLNTTETRTTVSDVDTGTLLEDRTSHTRTTEKRFGLNLTTRLQWRLGPEGSGDLLMLTPTLFHTEARSDSTFDLLPALSRPCDPLAPGLCATPSYDTGTSANDSRFSNARLNGQWRRRLGPVRLELNGGGGVFRAVNHTVRNEATVSSPDPVRVLQDRSVSRESSYTLNLKASGVAGGGESGAEHNLVGGAELEGLRRTETRSNLQSLGGGPLQAQLTDFGDDLQASSLRSAAYLQDEWNITPQWATQAGLRWEGIATQGDNGDGSYPRSRSSVFTPLFHAVWKPDPKSRDQVRLSLTRSYRAPGLSALIARPSISREYPVSGGNIITNPDSAGNPDLRPEQATGIDLALERYIDGGGVLSANLFHRRISDLIRGVTSLEAVSYSPVPRWVRRQRNIGNATTRGVELEAKFRLDQLVTAWLPVEVRSNLAFFDSTVDAVPGPDNRLDQQAKATANLGADYRLRAWPLTLGGNVNWVPGYTTQVDAGQAVTVSTKNVWDAYGLWTFSPTVGLRLLGSNLAPRDYASTTVDDLRSPAGTTERTTLRSNGPGTVNWQLRLELKL